MQPGSSGAPTSRGQRCTRVTSRSAPAGRWGWRAPQVSDVATQPAEKAGAGLAHVGRPAVDSQRQAPSRIDTGSGLTSSNDGPEFGATKTSWRLPATARPTTHLLWPLSRASAVPTAFRSTSSARLDLRLRASASQAWLQQSHNKGLRRASTKTVRQVKRIRRFSNSGNG